MNRSMPNPQDALRQAIIIVLLGCMAAHGYQSNPFVIKLAIPAPQDSPGGIIVADVDNDNSMDFLVTVPGHIAAYANDGTKLWVLQVDIVVGSSSESEGLPGHHGPGVAAADVDNDGKCEVFFLTKDSVLHIVDGKTGQQKAAGKPPQSRLTPRKLSDGKSLWLPTFGARGVTMTSCYRPQTKKATGWANSWPRTLYRNY